MSLPEIVENRKIKKNLTKITNKRYSFKGSWRWYAEEGKKFPPTIKKGILLAAGR